MGSAEKKFKRHWRDVISRCTNKRHLNFRYYSRVGVTDRWLVYENFCLDMYESFLDHYKKHPKNTTLDRIDNDKGYSKENFRWATWEIQYKNKDKNRAQKYRVAISDTSGKIVRMASKFKPLLIRFSPSVRLLLKKMARRSGMRETDYVRLLVENDALTNSSKK